MRHDVGGGTTGGPSRAQRRRNAREERFGPSRSSVDPALQPLFVSAPNRREGGNERVNREHENSLRFQYGPSSDLYRQHLALPGLTNRSMPVSGEKDFEFQSGGGARADSLSDLVGQLPGNQGAHEIRRLLERQINLSNEAQVTRDTLVSNQNQSQRDVRAINEAVFTGRKPRRGSSVSLPQVALAGISRS